MRSAAVIASALLLLACSREKPVLPSGPAGVDYTVTASLEEDMQTGLFQLELRSGKPVEVFYELLDQDGSVMADALYRVRDTTETVPDRIRDVRQWTAETPQLYTLHLKVDKQDSYHPVAFRRIEPYKKDTFLVNGCKVPFRGANLGQDAKRETLRTLKQAGVNALNTAPLPQALQDLCDSAGFYLYPQQDSLERPDIRSAALRHAWQDIGIKAEEPENGLFRIENYRQFSSIEDYTVRWWVERDGKPLNRLFKKPLHFATEPGSAEEFRIRLPRMKKPGEYRLFFEAISREDRPLVEKGSILASESFLLKDSSAPEEFQSKGPLTVTDGDTRLVIRGKDVEMVFDRADGSVKSLRVKERDLLPGGLTPVLPAENRAQCSWNLQGDSLVLRARYPDQSAVFTLLGSGVLKVESPGTAFRLQGRESGLRYFGQAPDLWAASAFKTLRTTVGEEGTHPETSWLETENFTLRGDSPFAFHSRGNQLTIIPDPAFTLVPRHK